MQCLYFCEEQPQFFKISVRVLGNNVIRGRVWWQACQNLLTLLFLNTCRAGHCLLGPLGLLSLPLRLVSSRKTDAAGKCQEPLRAVCFTRYLEDAKEDHTVHYSLIHWIKNWVFTVCQHSKSSPVVQSLSRVRLLNCSTPGSSVLQCLPEFALIHVHWVGDAF